MKKKPTEVLVMKKTIVIVLFIFYSFAVVSAQDSDDYNRNEFFVGYLNQQVNDAGRESFNGFDISYVRNVHRYVGIKADVSGAYYSFANGTGSTQFKLDRSVYNFLGGIQIKDSASEKRLQPFAHFLAGVGNARLKRDCPVCAVLVPTLMTSDTGFAAAVGGGLDITISKNVGFRAIQADYNPIHAGPRTSNNVRLGIGIVFK